MNFLQHLAYQLTCSRYPLEGHMPYVPEALEQHRLEIRTASCSVAYHSLPGQTPHCWDQSLWKKKSENCLASIICESNKTYLWSLYPCWHQEACSQLSDLCVVVCDQWIGEKKKQLMFVIHSVWPAPYVLLNVRGGVLWVHRCLHLRSGGALCKRWLAWIILALHTLTSCTRVRTTRAI